MATPLREQFEYYLQNQDELVHKYRGRFIVILNHEIIGVYKDQLEAVTETKKQGHTPGTFLVQKVEPGEGAYTEIFHSRVTFA